MKPRELVEKLKGMGVELSVSEGKVKFRAPVGVITPDLRQEMLANKESILRALHYQRGTKCDHCGANRWRYEPLAYERAGAHVCVVCKHAVKA
jgi:hypothetical protein